MQSGVGGGIVGLEGQLREFLRHFREPAVWAGITACVLSLDVPDWAGYTWIEEGPTAQQAPGTTAAITVFTVPLDERVTLEGLAARRTSGDNNLDTISLLFPSAYGSGDRILPLMVLTTAAPTVYWPHVGQTVTRAVGPTPVLMEPGTIVRISTVGDGVANTNFDASLVLKRSKIVRAVDPQL